MITPEYLQDIMFASSDAMEYVADRLLIKIALRIRDAVTEDGRFLTPAATNEIKRLLDMGVLLNDIQSAVNRILPDMQDIVENAFLEATIEIAKQNSEVTTSIAKHYGIEVPDFANNGISESLKRLDLTKAEIRRIEDAYTRTNGTLKNLTKTTALATTNRVIQSIDKAFANVRFGQESVQTATIEALKECAKQGIEVVAYPSGHTDRIETAVARAIRTGVNQSSGDVCLVRAYEMGVAYVKTSAHYGARVTKHNDYTNHSWWQGKVYSVDWNNPLLAPYVERGKVGDTDPEFAHLDEIKQAVQSDKVTKTYPDFMDSTHYGDIQGLCGINCRHSFYPFYPQYQDDTPTRINEVKNERIFRDSQKQRRMEGAIRETRRFYQMLKAMKSEDEEIKLATMAAKAKLERLSDEYMTFCKDNGLKPRNVALKTGKE